MPKSKVLLTVFLALAAASGAYWLSSDFHPDGILGMLQRLMQPFMFFPYMAGVIFGGNAHSPNELALAATLFVQFLVVFAVLFRIFGRNRVRA
jgi:hypothetical protein